MPSRKSHYPTSSRRLPQDIPLACVLTAGVRDHSLRFNAIAHDQSTRHGSETSRKWRKRSAEQSTYDESRVLIAGQPSNLSVRFRSSSQHGFLLARMFPSFWGFWSRRFQPLFGRMRCRAALIGHLRNVKTIGRCLKRRGNEALALEIGTTARGAVVFCERKSIHRPDAYVDEVIDVTDIPFPASSSVWSRKGRAGLAPLAGRTKSIGLSRQTRATGLRHDCRN